jgi:hypothetical protein
LLDELSLFEQYSAAAYCPGDNDQNASAAITCDAGNCPLVQAAAAESIVEFEKYGMHHSSMSASFVEHCCEESLGGRLTFF